MPYEVTDVNHAFSVFADGLDLKYSPELLEKMASMPIYFFDLWGEGCLLQTSSPAPYTSQRKISDEYNLLTLYVYVIVSPSDIVEGKPSSKQATRLHEIYGWVMGYFHEYLYEG